jgi:hypothetical protein
MLQNSVDIPKNKTPLLAEQEWGKGDAENGAI